MAPFIPYRLISPEIKELVPIYIHDSNTGMGVQLELWAAEVYSSNCEPECLMPSECRYKAQIRY